MRQGYRVGPRVRKDAAFARRRARETSQPEPDATSAPELENPSNRGTKGRFSPQARRERQDRVHAIVSASHRHRAQLGHELARLETEHGLHLPSFGIVDTVSTAILHRIACKDRRRLDGLGFEPASMTVRAKRDEHGKLFDPEPGAELFKRPSDGCCIQVYPHRVVVTGSVARITGRSNSRLHELTESDVVRAIHTMTAETLPITTHAATLLGHAWSLERIALARDFPGDAREFASSHRHVRWERCHSSARVYRGSTTVFAGALHRLSIYDKGLEMLARCERGAPPPGRVVRVERQWSSSRALRQLGEMMMATNRGYPRLTLTEQIPEGSATSVTRPFEHRVLHGILARELSLLGPPIEKLSEKNEVMALEMVERPVFVARMERVVDRKTMRIYRRWMATIDLRKLTSGSVLQAAYGPQSTLPWDTNVVSSTVRPTSAEHGPTGLL